MRSEPADAHPAPRAEVVAPGHDNGTCVRNAAATCSQQTRTAYEERLPDVDMPPAAGRPAHDEGGHEVLNGLWAQRSTMLRPETEPCRRPLVRGWGTTGRKAPPPFLHPFCSGGEKHDGPRPGQCADLVTVRRNGFTFG